MRERLFALFKSKTEGRAEAKQEKKEAKDEAMVLPLLNTFLERSTEEDGSRADLHTIDYFYQELLDTLRQDEVSTRERVEAGKFINDTLPHVIAGVDKESCPNAYKALTDLHASLKKLHEQGKLFSEGGEMIEKIDFGTRSDRSSGPS